MSDEAGEPAPLIAVRPQITLAVEHSGFLANSLTADDMPEVRRHAEHLVNILDGERGSFFGDLDRDGQSQNPGDGVGIRVYLEQAHDLMAEMVEAVTTTAELRVQAQAVVTMLEESQALVEDARDQALQVFAVDTPREANVIADSLQTLTDDLLETLDRVDAASLDVVRYEFYATPGSGVALDEAQGEEVRLGQMRLVDGASGPASSFELGLKGMAAAGEGAHYELWMQADAGELLRLGAFVVDEGSVEFAGSSETNLLAEYNRVLISLEADDETDVITPTQIVLTSSLPSDLLALSRQLLVSDEAGEPAPLIAVRPQITLAVEHSGFLANSLTADDMPEVRRHAEHLVNILDGERGSFFGDLDRDGQSQNPGDGVGIRVYLEQAHDLMAEMVEAVTTTAELRVQAQAVVTMLEESQALVEDARDQALQVFAVDTPREANVIADSLQTLTDDLLETLDRVDAASLDVVRYEFYATPGSGVALDEAQGEEVRLGQMRLVDGASGPASSFELGLKGMAAAGEGAHYELWMQADAGELLRLGAFVVDEGRVEFAGSSETNLLAEYNRVLISLEADDETDVITPTQIVLTSSLPSDLLALSRQLLVSDEAGEPAPLIAVRPQITLAVEHSGFLANSLTADDMPEVRRHAEHLVNILDGERGSFFGDLDRDGQSQNPGDGVGIRVYLEQAHDLMAEMVEAVTTTAELRVQALAVVTMLEESQTLVEDARDQALQVFATTSDVALQTISEDISQTVILLSDTELVMKHAALDLVTFKFYSAPAVFVTPLTPTGTVSGTSPISTTSPSSSAPSSPSSPRPAPPPPTR